MTDVDEECSKFAWVFKQAGENKGTSIGNCLTDLNLFSDSVCV
jgi:hypothetical protein